MTSVTTECDDCDVEIKSSSPLKEGKTPGSSIFPPSGKPSIDKAALLLLFGTAVEILRLVWAQAPAPVVL